MIVTEIKENNKKQDVYIDHEFAFALFKKELKRYRIVEGMTIGDEIVEEINNEIIIKRGFTYTGHLLAKRDYTTFQINQKLKKARYSQEMINTIIERLQFHQFLDDRRYTKNFYEYKKKAESKRSIQNKLMTKGISREIIEEIVKGNGESDVTALERLVAKKVMRMDINDEKSKQKLIRHLLYKGYKYENIRNVLVKYGKQNDENYNEY